MIVNIATRLYTDESRIDNTEHTVTISWTSPDDAFNTMQKVFTNAVDSMLTWISTNQSQEEKGG